MRTLIFVAALTLTGGVFAAEPGAQPLVRPSPPLAEVDLRAADMRFLLDAVASGVTQVRAGEIALERSRDKVVRAFAQRLVRDHSEANARLLRIARQKGVAVPREPSGAQSGMLDALRGVQARDFDQQFLQRAGVHAHREAIALFHAQLLRPQDDAALAQFAQETLPMLEEHLRMAQAALAHPGTAAVAPAGEAARAAQETVTDAVQVVQEMKRDPDVTDLLQRAHGVLVLPDYRRAALGLGLRSGAGVLVTRHGAGFSEPAFYRLEGASVGLQAGVSGGDIAYLLMTDRAVQRFRSNRSFSLGADAGLTFGSYSERRHRSQGKLEDVVVWSGARGAYLGGSVGISRVAPDGEANHAYYGADAAPNAILGGLVENPHNNVLGLALGA